MKKNLLFAIAITAASLSACKKDSPDEPENDDPFGVEYSNLTVQQHKQKLEKAGIDFVGKIESLPNEKFIDVLDYFSTLEPGLNDETAIKTILSISNASERKDIKGIINSVSALDTATNKLSEHYARYTYNKNTGDWDKTTSNKLEFIFPASDAANDTTMARMTVSYVASATKATIDGKKYELPSSVAGSLRVGAKEELRLTASYEYKSDGTPTKSDINLVLGSFTLKSNTTNSSTEASSSLSFLKGTETLLAFSAKGSSNISVGSIDDNGDDAEIENIVKNGNVTFEIMNIKMIGAVDIEGLSKANKTIDYNQSETVWIQKEAENLNKFAKFAAINKEDNTLIAKLTFKGSSSEDCWEWNGARYCDTNTYIEPLLVFKDGSPLAFDSFFEDSFSDLIDEMEDFGDQF